MVALHSEGVEAPDVGGPMTQLHLLHQLTLSATSFAGAKSLFAHWRHSSTSATLQGTIVSIVLA